MITPARATSAPLDSKCVILYTDHGSPVLVDPFFHEMLDSSGGFDLISSFSNCFPGLDPVDHTHPGFHFLGLTQGNHFFLYLDPPSRRSRR